jgi:hypothetical protein
MKASFSARQAVTLSFVAAAFAGALPAPAKAEPDSDDCSAMAPIGDEFRAAVTGLFTPEELKQIKSAKNNKGSDPEGTIGKAVAHVFEKDPKTGESRLVGFLGHLRRANELANDASGQLEDPQAADAVDKLATGLDNYLALYDQAVHEPSSSDGDQSVDGDQTEDSGSSTSLAQIGPALQGFADGMTAYGDYMDEHCGSAGGSTLMTGTEH